MVIDWFFFRVNIWNQSIKVENMMLVVVDAIQIFLLTIFRN